MEYIVKWWRESLFSWKEEISWYKDIEINKDWCYIFLFEVVSSCNMRVLIHLVLQIQGVDHAVTVDGSLHSCKLIMTSPIFRLLVLMTFKVFLLEMEKAIWLIDPQVTWELPFESWIYTKMLYSMDVSHQNISASYLI